MRKCFASFTATVRSRLTIEPSRYLQCCSLVSDFASRTPKHCEHHGSIHETLSGISSAHGTLSAICSALFLESCIVRPFLSLDIDIEVWEVEPVKTLVSPMSPSEICVENYILPQTDITRGMATIQMRASLCERTPQACLRFPLRFRRKVEGQHFLLVE